MARPDGECERERHGKAAREVERSRWLERRCGARRARRSAGRGARARGSERSARRRRGLAQVELAPLLDRLVVSQLGERNEVLQRVGALQRNARKPRELGHVELDRRRYEREKLLLNEEAANLLLVARRLRRVARRLGPHALHFVAPLPRCAKHAAEVGGGILRRVLRLAVVVAERAHPHEVALGVRVQGRKRGRVEELLQLHRFVAARRGTRQAIFKLLVRVALRPREGDVRDLKAACHDVVRDAQQRGGGVRLDERASLATIDAQRKLVSGGRERERASVRARVERRAKIDARGGKGHA